MNGFVDWLRDTAERAARTFAQVLVATGLFTGLSSWGNWKDDFAVAGLAAGATVVNAIAAPAKGAPPVASVDVNLSTSAMGTEPK